MSDTKPTVLVVDDEPSVTQLIALMLEDSPFDVITVNDGEYALSFLEKHTVDVVLTDLRMDGMDGFELMTRIHQCESACPVVAMTACDSYDMVLEALKCGAYDYLEKPLQNPESIRALLQRAIEAGRLSRQNAELLARLTVLTERQQTANERLLMLNRKLHTLAITDSLTGLHNRRYIEDTLEYEVGRRLRNGHALSMILIEIDRSADFTGEFGKASDTQAVRQIAEVLKNNNDLSDINARVADSTFAILLPETNTADALDCAKRLCAAVAATPIAHDGRDYRLTIRAGVASLTTTTPAIDYMDIVARARQALRQASAGTACDGSGVLPDAGLRAA